MSYKSSIIEERFLMYFDRIVLCRYRSRPDLFCVHEDDMGGELEVIHTASEDDSLPFFRIRFGFRQLSNDRVCVAAFVPDLQTLPESEQTAWAADAFESPSFASPDEAFDRWSQRNLQGSWESEDGPLRNLERELELVQALTRFELGQPLFRDAHNPALRYPVAENSEAFTFAMLELFRLVVDGLSLRRLKCLAGKLKVELPTLKEGESRGAMNTLKTLLPEEMHEIVCNPLHECANQRNKLHGVPNKPAYAFAAFKNFHQRALTICGSVTALRKWLEQSLHVSGDICLKREQKMENFPKFDGPLRPNFKTGKFEEAVGKTIAKIESGEVVPGKGGHRYEAIVFHFTDGTALAIDGGSNAGNLESRFEGLDASMFSADLIPAWAPNPRITDGNKHTNEA